jgi:hypothetical protein
MINNPEPKASDMTRKSPAIAIEFEKKGCILAAFFLSAISSANFQNVSVSTETFCGESLIQVRDEVEKDFKQRLSSSRLGARTPAIFGLEI